MITYVIIAIGTLWGIFTLIGIREEDKDIKQMVESARKHSQNLNLPDQDLEDQWWQANKQQYAPLAQLVEQWTFNPCVPGSNPGGRTMTIIKNNHRKCSALTSVNNPCLRRAISFSLFCRVHQSKKKYDK